jgi:hypothetical protein
VDDHVGILVAVVLVGDVDVRAGMDVVADLHLEVADDVAPPPDHAPITDTHHRVGDHVLTRDHAGRDAHVGTDQGVPTHSDPTLTEDRPGGEGEAAASTKPAESGSQAIVGPGRSVAGHPVPSAVDQ